MKTRAAGDQTVHHFFSFFFVTVQLSFVKDFKSLSFDNGATNVLFGLSVKHIVPQHAVIIT